MFPHPTRKLTAYRHGELSADERRRVTAHLESCERCRRELDKIRLVADLLTTVPLSQAPKNLTESAFRAGTEEKPRLNRRWAAAAAVAAVALIVTVAINRPYTGSGWEIDRLNGGPESLAKGQWFETDRQTGATVKLNTVGQLRMEPNTKLRLLETSPEEHRMELQRGTVHAQVWAPPRLFFVETPSVTAIDLGCAYTLKVDDSGDTLLYVTAGLVELESKGRSSTVPAGDYARTRGNSGPGTPYAADASSELQQALAVIDFGDPAARPEAVGVVLKESRVNDLVTLWHLLPRVGTDLRERLFTRMAELETPPEGVTAEGIRQLDPRMMTQWKSRLGLTWQ